MNILVCDTRIFNNSDYKQENKDFTILHFSIYYQKFNKQKLTSLTFLRKFFESSKFYVRELTIIGLFCALSAFRNYSSFSNPLIFLTSWINSFTIPSTRRVTNLIINKSKRNNHGIKPVITPIKNDGRGNFQNINFPKNEIALSK